MCQFASFFIHESGNRWECADLRHHEITRDKLKLGDQDWFEVEWLENGTLTVRVCDRSDNTEQFYKDCILTWWKTQADCVQDLVKRTAKHGGNLDLRYTKITKLPECLTSIDGSLDLSGTPITKLPEGLTSIGGSLDLSGTQITKLPESLTSIGGSLDLSGTQITKLPESLTSIGGSLYLRGTLITNLPESLTSIGGSLYLSGTNITELPKSIRKEQVVW